MSARCWLHFLLFFMLFSAVHWIYVNEEQFYFDAKICTIHKTQSIILINNLINIIVVITAPVTPRKCSNSWNQTTAAYSQNLTWDAEISLTSRLFCVSCIKAKLSHSAPAPASSSSISESRRRRTSRWVFDILRETVTQVYRCFLAAVKIISELLGLIRHNFCISWCNSALPLSFWSFLYVWAF